MQILKRNRILSCLFVLTIIFGMLPVSAFAETEKTPDYDLTQMDGAELIAEKKKQTRGVGDKGTLRVLYNTFSADVGVTTAFDYVAQLPAKAMFKNGKYLSAYCLQHDLPANDGTEYTWESMGKNQQQLISFIMGLGFKWDDPNQWNNDANNYKWVVTQLLVYASVNGNVKIDATGIVNFGATVDVDMQKCADKSTDSAGMMTYYNTLKKELTQVLKRPSFSSKEAQTTTPLILEWKNGQYEYSGTDANGVFSRYDFKINGATVMRTGNNIKITAPDALAAQGEVVSDQATYTPSIANKSTAIWKTNGGAGGTGEQDFAVWDGYHDGDPISAYIKIRFKADGKAKLVKTSDDGIVAGLTFEITGNGKTETKTTDANGEIGLAGLDIYDANNKKITYTAKEINVPGRYQTPATQTFELKEGDTTTIKFHNKVKNQPVEIKKISDDGIVAGFTFEITGGGITETKITDANGLIKIDLPVYDGNGQKITYTIKEINPPGRYDAPQSQTFTLTEGQTTSVKFENKLKTAPVELQKTSEDGEVAGLRFEIKGGGKTYIETTDQNGYFKVELPIYDGNNQKITYTIKEINVPVKYVVPDEQEFTLTEGQTTKVEFKNTLKKWKVKVKKTDKETAGDPQGDASLSGAVYGIYQNGQPLDEYTTDANGEFESKYYICGNDYTMQEITPSEGYLLDPTIHQVGVDSGTTIIELTDSNADVTEQAIKGKVQIHKILQHQYDHQNSGIREPEKDAEFQIYLLSAGSFDQAKASEKDLLITDDKGIAVSKLLPFGTYRVHQTKGKAGYMLTPDFDVFIAEDLKTYTYYLGNVGMYSEIKIVKKDEETNQIIPVSGVGFKIKDTVKDEYVKQSVRYPTPIEIDEFYTDTAGQLMMPEKLLYGEYQLEEIHAPTGYVLSETPIPFIVDGTQQIVEVIKKNSPQKGIIHLKKTGDIFSSILEKDGIFTPVFEWKGLSDLEFKVIADEDITTPDGTIRAKKDDIVDTLATDKDGFATSIPLYLGKYRVEEIKTKAPFSILENPVAVELVYKDQTVAIMDESVTIQNERQKLKLHLEKLLEKDEKLKIGTQDEHKNISFALYADEELTAEDGKKIPKDSLIEIIKLDENLKAIFTADLPHGKYFVTEKSTDEHYLLSAEKYPIEFTYTDEKVKEVDLQINDKKPIENKLIRGKIEGLKLSEDGKKLESAVIGLFKTDLETTPTVNPSTKPITSQKFTEENALMVAKSDKDGKFQFENLPFGTYIVREIKAPDNFEINETIYKVTVSEDKQVIEVVIYDNYAVGNIHGIKKSEDGTVLKGVKFGLFGGAETEFTKEKSIEVAETNDKGEFRFSYVYFGKYKVKELESLAGYVLTDKVYEVDVKSLSESKDTADNTRSLNSSQPSSSGKSESSSQNSSSSSSLGLPGSEQNWGAPSDSSSNSKTSSENSSQNSSSKSSNPNSADLDNKNQVKIADIVNQYTKIEILKVDETGKALKGAEFTLKNSDGKELAKWTSDEKAYRIDKIPVGTKLTITETKAPDGYQKVADITYEVKKTGDIQKIEVKNTKVTETPKSGVNTPKTGDGRINPIFLWILLVAALIGVGFLVRWHIKKKNLK